MIFKRSRTDVSDNLAKRYLDEGKVEQALKVLDNDSAKLAQVIENYLGVVHQEGQQVLRLPYYRPLTILNPEKPIRRSELHIIRQIFSGLTRMDENEVLQADLAHSWEMLTPKHWRFYLRPGVRFHNGIILTSDMVIDSLNRLKQKNLFSHVIDIKSPNPSVVDICLSSPDYRLPILLAESCARVTLPKSERTEQYDKFPVGTGPYKVIKNDDQRLTLQAYDGYFGYRPLIDLVEVWVVDEAHSSFVFPSLNNPIKPESSAHADEVDLDPGCTLLLLNRKQGLAADERWAEYFSNRLNSSSLYRLIPPEKVADLGVFPAYGLKPGWYHQPVHAQQVKPPQDKTVKIAYHGQHPMFPTQVSAIKALFAEDGISVELVGYDYSLDKPEEIDIWLKAMGITSNREDALAGWLLDYGDVQAMSREEDFIDWKRTITGWLADETAPFPAKELGKSLVEKRQIIPMLHCWLGVSKDQCGALQNAKCNALGWFDFGQVWVKPDSMD